ncbi:MAG: phosphoribosylamine--glycine ligase [Verrucomicrobiota bacterium]
MKAILVGKGGREHALAWSLRRSPACEALYVWPGSDALFELARPVPADSMEELVAFAASEKIDLVIAGEEKWLVEGDGLAALCQREGVLCWGPPKESAQLEASKVFAKEFLVRHGIPTADYLTVSDYEEGKKALERFPVVLKFDGLAAGKGVAVCGNPEEAEAFLEEVFLHKRFGEGQVLVEACLAGPEVSIFAAVSGGAYQIFSPARDYKRLGDGDEGPNTGGMGAVASLDLIEPSLLAEIENKIVQPTVAGLQADRLPYRGFLYFGVMLTEEGPQVLEYNCRFGDPECQAVMPLMEGDLAQYLLEATRGEIREELLRTQSLWSVCLVAASAGYPASSRSGDLIGGLGELEGVEVFHAGTRSGEAGWETNGGRVLAVVAGSESRQEALERAHREMAKVRFDGKQVRSDIGRLHFD